MRRLPAALVLALCLAVPARAADPAVPKAATPAGAEPASTAAAEPAPGAEWRETITGMEFRWIPTGCFVMGAPEDEPGREDDEGPQHTVCLSGFWMGATEVTGGQWRAVMGDDPSLIKNDDQYPVDMISWDMAQNYVRELNARTGGGFRLPTEAEWEYACRAGTTTAYSFGPEISKEQAAFDKPFRLAAEPIAPKKRRGSRRKAVRRQPRTWPNMHTTLAASYPANAFGLHDMHGNLWEWCQDEYDAEAYRKTAKENPVVRGDGESRVMRGGSWVTKADALRSANRSHAWPDMATAFYGLRLVRDARPAEPLPETEKP